MIQAVLHGLELIDKFHASNAISTRKRFLYHAFANKWY